MEEDLFLYMVSEGSLLGSLRVIRCQQGSLRLNMANRTHESYIFWKVYDVHSPAGIGPTEQNRTCMYVQNWHLLREISLNDPNYPIMTT